MLSVMSSSIEVAGAPKLVAKRQANGMRVRIFIMVERRALPPGENVVVGGETVELMPVGSGDLFAFCFG